MFQGKNGKGKITYDVYLSNIRWVSSVGGVLPVMGEAGEGKKGWSRFTALVAATGGLDCASKAGTATSKTGGATRFVVVGTYAIWSV